jgi:hypothetical protein
MIATARQRVIGLERIEFPFVGISTFPGITASYRRRICVMDFANAAGPFIWCGEDYPIDWRIAR